MNARMRRSAVNALMMSLATAVTSNAAHAADAPAGDGWLSVGTFSNNGAGVISYEGEYASYISAALPLNDTQHTVITVNLGALLTSLGHQAFDQVSVRDSGANTYGANSPGVDLDYFVFANLWDGAGVTYSYDGPYEVHDGESSESLATRLTDLDGESNHPAHAYMRVMSLGEFGMATATMSGLPSQGPIGGGEGGGGDPEGPPDVIGNHRDAFDITPVTLHVSEFGFSESFEIYVHITSVPAPGALALLTCAGLMPRGRRRRG